MNIDPNKVIDAIAALKAAADALTSCHAVSDEMVEAAYGPYLSRPANDLRRAALAEVLSLISGSAQAAECIKAAAALQASVQIAGLTHRAFHSTGEQS